MAGSSGSAANVASRVARVAASASARHIDALSSDDPLERREREVEADHLGAGLREPLHERHVLAARPGGRAEALQALLVDRHDHDLGARLACGAQRLPGVEQLEVGYPERRDELGAQAQEQQRGRGGCNPATLLAAGDDLRVEETGSGAAH